MFAKICKYVKMLKRYFAQRPQIPQKSDVYISTLLLDIQIVNILPNIYFNKSSKFRNWKKTWLTLVTTNGSWEEYEVLEFIGRKCCVMINLWWKSRKFTLGLFLRLSRYRQLSNNYSNPPFLIYCLVSYSIVFKSSRVSSQFTRLTNGENLQDCQSFWEVS